MRDYICVMLWNPHDSVTSTSVSTWVVGRLEFLHGLTWNYRVVEKMTRLCYLLFISHSVNRIALPFIFVLHQLLLSSDFNFIFPPSFTVYFISSIWCIHFSYHILKSLFILFCSILMYPWLRWTGCVARMEEVMSVFKIYTGKSTGKEGLGVGGRTTLE